MNDDFQPDPQSAKTAHNDSTERDDSVEHPVPTAEQQPELPAPWSDEDELNPRQDHSTEVREHQAQCQRWANFWIATWAGTTFAGILFGGALGFLTMENDPSSPVIGLFFGLLWAGGMGAAVFIHVGILCWIIWCLDRPLLIATIAGMLTGLICGLVLFSIITGPMGAIGAYAAGKSFLNSGSGKKFTATIKSAKDKSGGRLKYTTSDLFMRMTAIGMIMAFWSALVGFYFSA